MSIKSQGPKIGRSQGIIQEGVRNLRTVGPQNIGLFGGMGYEIFVSLGVEVGEDPKAIGENR
jgi:hypothetical protein